MPQIGPVILSVQGDQYVDAARISSIIWEGATNSGDTVEIRCPATNTVLWASRTSDTQTYLGASIGPGGIHAPYGFKLFQLSAGRVFVYLREE